MGENRFLELYERGRISDLRSLSRAWHELVKRTHPDAIGSETSSQLFSQLHEEYHAARIVISARADGLAPTALDNADLTALANASADPIISPSRQDFYRELNDIIRRGFPLDPENPRLPSTYFQSRKTLSAWLAQNLGPDSFEKFERETLALKNNSTYFATGPLMPVLYQFCDFHSLGSAGAEKFIRSEWPRMERLLKRRGKNGLVAALDYLVRDLANGAARF